MSKGGDFKTKRRTREELAIEKMAQEGLSVSEILQACDTVSYQSLKYAENCVCKFYLDGKKDFMKNWGEIQLVQVDYGSLFAALYNELLDDINPDGSGFHHNLQNLVEAFRDGKLFSLRVIETNDMYHEEIRNPLFAERTFYALPVLCVVGKRDQDCEIIWVHTRARRYGFGRKMVELLGIERAIDPLPGSESFWNACGVKSVASETS
jgi:hypothetical protein